MEEALTPLTGYDDQDDLEAIEHFRLQLRRLRKVNATGVLHLTTRTEKGQRRHQEANFQDRLEPQGKRT